MGNWPVKEVGFCKVRTYGFEYFCFSDFFQDVFFLMNFITDFICYLVKEASISVKKSTKIGAYFAVEQDNSATYLLGMSKKPRKPWLAYMFSS